MLGGADLTNRRQRLYWRSCESTPAPFIPYASLAVSDSYRRCMSGSVAMQRNPGQIHKQGQSVARLSGWFHCRGKWGGWPGRRDCRQVERPQSAGHRENRPLGRDERAFWRRGLDTQQSADGAGRGGRQFRGRACLYGSDHRRCRPGEQQRAQGRLSECWSADGAGPGAAGPWLGPGTKIPRLSSGSAGRARGPDAGRREFRRQKAGRLAQDDAQIGHAIDGNGHRWRACDTGDVAVVEGVLQVHGYHRAHGRLARAGARAVVPGRDIDGAADGHRSAPWHTRPSG